MVNKHLGFDCIPVETKVQLYFLHRDLMDRLVDEAEGLAVDSSSSVCSGAGGGGRLEATTDQQLSLLNSITASDLTGEYCGKVIHFQGKVSFFLNINVLFVSGPFSFE